MDDTLFDHLNAPRGLRPLLTEAYWSRYGCPPPTGDRAWLQEPWVLPHLRWLATPWDVLRGDGLPQDDDPEPTYRVLVEGAVLATGYAYAEGLALQAALAPLTVTLVRETSPMAA